jgi:hypothetical protein
MKIYINNLNLNKLNDIRESLNDILTETNIYTEVYTNESIYHIDEKTIYSVTPKDGEIILHHNYYDQFTLICDHSYFLKNNAFNVFGNEHLHKKIKKYIYKTNPKSKLSFVIEMTGDLHDNKFVENDVYFESYDIIDIKELFIKQEIIEFLSLLN